MTHDRPQAERAMMVDLECENGLGKFQYKMPGDVDWLAQHWMGTIDAACPLCRQQHRYRTKTAYLNGAMSRSRPVDDMFSSSTASHDHARRRRQLQR